MHRRVERPGIDQGADTAEIVIAPNNQHASVGPLDAEAAGRVLQAATDIALVVDRQGLIEDFVHTSKTFADVAADEWRGRPWIETVTPESRPKIEELLRPPVHGAPIRWREVNHSSRRGIQLPVRYSTVSVGTSGRILAIGRDLSTVSTLQQRVLDVQRSMEREYARLRQAETRYRLLFQLSDEAVVIVDSATLRIVDANPAAGRIAGAEPTRLIGRPYLELFDDGSIAAARDALVAARMASRPEPAAVRVAGGAAYSLSASQFRQDGTTHVLLRLTAQGVTRPARDGAGSSPVLRLVERLPDAFVVTDPQLRILDTNPAFLELAELSSPAQARGAEIGRWLGRPGVDLPVLAANLKEYGAVRGFSTVIRGEFGASDEVDVTAVAALDAEVPSHAFVIRRLARRAAGAGRAEAGLPNSPDQLTDLIGRMPLKQIVSETTDVIERMCIEAALKLTRDNRASAAQMLGLSRQSLYAKLRRFGLGGLDDNAAAALSDARTP